MTRPNLPPRGIFVPNQIIFNSQLPAVVILTWIQLRCLAWRGWVTPPLSIPELASLLGIHPSRLISHLSHHQDNSALTIHPEKDGKITIAFHEAEIPTPQNSAKSLNLSASNLFSTVNQELPGISSYFPPRILGYLSFQDEQEDYLIFDNSVVLKDKADPNKEISAPTEAYPIFQDCKSAQHARHPE